MESSVQPGGAAVPPEATRCDNMCGMCPSCVFAPKPPASTRCQWKASDTFKRRFVVGLLLRCDSVQVLESVQSALRVTSWHLSTYARSRSQTSAQRDLSPDRAMPGRPLGFDTDAVRLWFTTSTDAVKSQYLCGLLSGCELELLRLVANLTNVLLVRKKRGFLQGAVRLSGGATHQQEDSEEDSDDPALMVVPGSSRSMSGVGRYRDFIGCLPVDLSKRILGSLDENTLRRCQKVSRRWKQLVDEVMQELSLRKVFQEQFKAMMKLSGPFEAVYANIRTRTVPMEERNLYCNAHLTAVLLDKEDPHRVADYRGGPLMATGSKDCLVHLFYLGCETKHVAVMKGHVGSIRAVLLCQERDLLVTASCDANIRCWSVKTSRCVMVLYGHSSTVNCLDVHADTLVSGSKDCRVKVWNLQTGEPFEDCNFKHHSSVQCVKLKAATVCSSCDRGLIKLWDAEKAWLLRVIDAHQSSVKCLFLDEWHLLTGDCDGQVMAWSVSGDAKGCLMTFIHPREVKSLTLSYLRVITGCADGKIRIFNFLTGDCLRDIRAEARTGCLLSVHCHDNKMLVNSSSRVKLLEFAKVVWDYAGSTAEDGRDEGVPSHTADVRDVVQVTPLSQRVLGCRSKKPERAARRRRARPAPGEESRESAKVALSEKATCDRMEKRGPHHPLTRDAILLKVDAIQRAQRVDEVSINMERNAMLRDSWGPVHSSQDPSCTDFQDTNPRPVQKQNLEPAPDPGSSAHRRRRVKTCILDSRRAAANRNMTLKEGDGTTARGTTRGQSPRLDAKNLQPKTNEKP
ncbi:F-box/WD repeat-containing protein 10 [Aulostomus maculatus]